MNQPQMILFNRDIGATIGISALGNGIIAFNQLSKVYSPGEDIDWANEDQNELLRMSFIDPKSIDVVIGWLTKVRDKMIEYKEKTESYSLATWEEEP